MGSGNLRAGNRTRDAQSTTATRLLALTKALFHCVVRLGSACISLQFSTALDWAGLYTWGAERPLEKLFHSVSPHQDLLYPFLSYQQEERLYFLIRQRNSHFWLKKGALVQTVSFIKKSCVDPSLAVLI